MIETKSDPPFDYLDDIARQMEAAQTETANQTEQEKGENPSLAQEPVQAPKEQQHAGQAKRMKPEPPRFHSRQEARNMPVTGFIAKGLVPRFGLGQIFGAPGCCKSFSTMMFVHCLVANRPFCGRKTKKCAVYYFHLEGVGGVPKRLAALDVWRDEVGWEPQDDDLHFWFEPFQINKQSLAMITKIIKQDKNENKLVVIDTQMQSMAGVDESSAKEMSAKLSMLRDFARDINGVVCLIHHTGKDKSQGARGSSAQLGDFDFQIEVRKEGDTIIWSTEKERDEAKNQDVRFKLRVIEDVIKDEDGEFQSSCVAIPETELTEEEKTTLASAKPAVRRGRKSDKFNITKDIFYQAIHKFGKEGRLHESKFREVFFEKFPVNSEDAAKAKEARRKAYSRQIDALIAERVIEQVGEWFRYREDGEQS